jgi:hypothetical protein
MHSVFCQAAAEGGSEMSSPSALVETHTAPNAEIEHLNPIGL